MDEYAELLAGIGELRAILGDEKRIIEKQIEDAGKKLRAGSDECR